MSEFKPAEGVTLLNAMEYAAAIGDAVRDEITVLPVEQRSVVIGMVAATLEMTRNSLLKFRDNLERQGLATPPSDEQLLQIRMIMRRAAEDKKES